MFHFEKNILLKNWAKNAKSKRITRNRPPSNVKVWATLLTKAEKGVNFVLGFLGLYFDGGSLMTCRHFYFYFGSAGFVHKNPATFPYCDAQNLATLSIVLFEFGRIKKG